MSASDMATLKKKLYESKPSSKLILKRKCYHSWGCCDDFRSCEPLKERVKDKYFEKRLDFEPNSPSVTGNMLPLQYLSDWYLHGLYVLQKFRNIIPKKYIIHDSVLTYKWVVHKSIHFEVYLQVFCLEEVMMTYLYNKNWKIKHVLTLLWRLKSICLAL